MHTQFKGNNYEPGSDLVSMTTKKLESLSKYLSHEGSSAQAQVILGKASGSHQTGNIWQAEINLSCEGKNYNAKATRENINAATNATLAELTREVRRNRARDVTRKRKGGGFIKSMLSGFNRS